MEAFGAMHQTAIQNKNINSITLKYWRQTNDLVLVRDRQDYQTLWNQFNFSPTLLKKQYLGISGWIDQSLPARTTEDYNKCTRKNIGNRNSRTYKNSIMLKTERMTSGLEQCNTLCSSQGGFQTALSKYNSGCNEWTGWEGWVTSLKVSTITFSKGCWICMELITSLFWQLTWTVSSRT